LSLGPREEPHGGGVYLACSTFAHKCLIMAVTKTLAYRITLYFNTVERLVTLALAAIRVIRLKRPIFEDQKFEIKKIKNVVIVILILTTHP